MKQSVRVLDELISGHGRHVKMILDNVLIDMNRIEEWMNAQPHTIRASQSKEEINTQSEAEGEGETEECR